MNQNAKTSSSVYISNQKQQRGEACLLLVDPQIDFVTGSLTVPNAKEDCQRIATFIRKNMKRLQEIYVTLDTHMNYHIAHPMFWTNSEGKEPGHFTQITHKQVKDGVWTPKEESMKAWALEYTRLLEKKPRLEGLPAFTLTIWPPHCLMGTQGHSVEPKVMEALHEWEKSTNKTVHFTIKGNNSKTEHYSAFRAEVIVEEDPKTGFNEALLKDLNGHSRIYVAGEAKSHCVNFTVRDLADKLGADVAAKKVILLEGGMSSVVGFQAQGDEFVKDMLKLGIKTQDLRKDEEGSKQKSKREENSTREKSKM